MAIVIVTPERSPRLEYFKREVFDRSLAFVSGKSGEVAKYYQNNSELLRIAGNGGQELETQLGKAKILAGKLGDWAQTDIREIPKWLSALGSGIFGPGEKPETKPNPEQRKNLLVSLFNGRVSPEDVKYIEGVMRPITPDSINPEEAIKAVEAARLMGS